MNDLKPLLEALYEHQFKKHIDEKNLIHKDIKGFLLGQGCKNKGFSDVIKLIENKASRELTKEIIDDAEKGNFDTLYFDENRINIDGNSINNLRERRRVEKVELNSSPITNPYRQVVLTSNILLTLPKSYEKFDFEQKYLIDMDEAQKNWYDHPIPLDIADSSNEIIYGLTKLSESIKMETEETVTVILSVSVTHDSLNLVAKEYIISKLRDKDLSNLDIYIFTQNGCDQITNALDKDDKNLQKSFGVCGKYGRHYTFLKAIVPLYKEVINENILATFKIDLDQVFPQKELKMYTGKYAFENFKSMRWGATGVDVNGKKIRLSMAAGGLVNEGDIEKDLFTPDVKKPKDKMNIEQLFFNSGRPQYVSTVGEICMKYDNNEECITRYHITGGMNGILVDDLVKFRAFTPSFFTRAEDQGYLLSVINKEVDGEYMRCVHLDEFVMRHDKEAFLSEDLKHFEIPKSVGDFERMLIFSHYSYDILGCGDYIKQELYPFTGSFVLKRPYTSVLLRTLCRLLILEEDEAEIFLETFIPRITNLMKKIEGGVLKETYQSEKNAYGRYYDMLLKGITEPAKSRLSDVFEKARLSL